MDYLEDQKKICKKYKVDFWESPIFFKVGISNNVKEGILPINGMRYHPEGNTTGWYIWAGEEFSNDTDFFVPLHVKHLEEWAPIIIKYLGLPPGYRFLVTPDYEDVWSDDSLLG